MNQPAKARVFLVDDDEDDRFLVSQALTHYGPACHVTPLASGADLLRTLAQATLLPRLIVLDLNMPLMNGLEVLKRLRQNYSQTDLPVVIMTTSDQDDDKEQAAALQANDFITKPATAKQYAQIVLQLKERWLIN
jgi:CheY-like chemotaxis protein